MTASATPYRGFLLLRDKRNRHEPYGWTESLWINGDSFNASLAALEQIAAPRLAMLPKGFAIERLKVTNPLLPRAVADRNCNAMGGYDCNAQPVWSVLLVRFRHEGYTTQYTLGGVPNDAVSAAGVHPTQVWQAAFRDFEAAIKKHCVMMNEDRARFLSLPGAPVMEITQAHAMAKITTAEDFFDADGMGRTARVILSGAVALPSLNGIHEVWVADRRTAYTSGAMAVSPDLAADSITIRKHEKMMNPISNVSILRTSSHKRGMGHGYPASARRRRRC